MDKLDGDGLQQLEMIIGRCFFSVGDNLPKVLYESNLSSQSSQSN